MVPNEHRSLDLPDSDAGEQFTLPIQGLRCENCVRQVTTALQSVPGVLEATVSLADRRASVRGLRREGLLEQLKQAIVDAGFQVRQETGDTEAAKSPAANEASQSDSAATSRQIVNSDGPADPALVSLQVPQSPPPTQAAAAVDARDETPHRQRSDSPSNHWMLDIEGMHCASCVGRVESSLSEVAGVSGVWVNLATQQATVEGDHRATSEALIAAVERAGYRAAPAAPPESAAESMALRGRMELRGWRNRLIFGGTTLALMVLVAQLPGIDSALRGWLQWLLATPLQVYVGWPYFRGAVARLRHGSASMDTLVALGTGTAYAAGLAGLLAGQMSMTFMDAGMILTFITLGKYLEVRAKGRVSAAILHLLDLTPVEAVLLREGQTRTVPVSQVVTGDMLVIRPGDKIPLDATVSAGGSHVDESWLTGESRPVEKTPGERIFAGTVNGEGALRAVVLRTFTQTTLAQTIELVRRAQESKADVQRLADRVVAWFVPVILVVALTTLAAWALVGQPADGLRCAVAVLVVACPCALGLATPTAMLVASGRGAEEGILIKNAQSLELAGKLTTVVLDKTGTITQGRPRVCQVIPSGAASERRLLSVAVAVEQLSKHPLATAVLEYARQQQLAVPAADHLQVRVGEGLEAERQGVRLLVGNEPLLQRHEIRLDDAWRTRLAAERRLGRTPLLVAEGPELLGALLVADPIAAGSREAVAELRRLGLRLIMLSGDRRETAEAIAREVGLTEVRAEVKPAEKQAVVKELQAGGEIVAMVGDGINDAPALAVANLGIALGSGADVAIEAADLVLVRHHLALVPRAILLAQQTRRTIWQNLGWAFVYNLTLVPVAAGVLAPWGIRMPPAWAAAAMAASSVSVVANSLRLRWRRLGTSRRPPDQGTEPGVGPEAESGLGMATETRTGTATHGDRKP
jgi:Cu+-exporting ATPase